MLLDFLNGANPAYLDFVLNLVDVRIAALGHYLAAVSGRPGQRYVLGGHNLRLGELLGVLKELTGLPMPRARVPFPVAYVSAIVSEFVADHLTRTAPRATACGVMLARASQPFDSSKAVRELGLPTTSVKQSLRDTVNWFVKQGLLERPLRRRNDASSLADPIRSP